MASESCHTLSVSSSVRSPPITVYLSSKLMSLNSVVDTFSVTPLRSMAFYDPHKNTTNSVSKSYDVHYMYWSRANTWEDAITRSEKTVAIFYLNEIWNPRIHVHVSYKSDSDGACTSAVSLATLDMSRWLSASSSFLSRAIDLLMTSCLTLSSSESSSCASKLDMRPWNKYRPGQKS